MAPGLRMHGELKTAESVGGSTRELIISTFIFVHISALVLWCASPFPLYWSIVPVFKPYITFLGFWNQWKMFSHPKTYNIYLTADVVLSNGKILEWNFPRMEKIDCLTRIGKERYRKWAHEYVNENNLARPDACRFIARKLNDGTAKPVKVMLVRHWSWIRLPYDHTPTREEQSTFYAYTVKPEDLI